MRKYSKIFTALFLLAIGTVACDRPNSDTKISISTPFSNESLRVNVERIGVFHDPLAYGEQRGIYIITDNKTGNEFIGISGIGISETGTHQCGKTHVSDER